MNDKDLEEGILPKKQSIRPPPRMSNDDKRIASKQPLRHAKNKGLAERVFGACCAANQDLNRREVKYYNKFVNKMINEYDHDNPDHEANL